MIVENALAPDQEQLKAMQQPGPDQSICLVNLLEYRKKAAYPDGQVSDLSGKQAYQRYTEAVNAMFSSYGGKMVFVGEVSYLRMGVVEQLWDEIAIVYYPSRTQILKMTMSPDWKEVSVHRIAGLEGQLNIETIQSAAFPDVFGD